MQKFVVEFVCIQIIYIFLVFLYLMEQVSFDVLLDSLKKITALMPLICKFVSFSFFFLSLLPLFMSHLRLTSLLISFHFFSSFSLFFLFSCLIFASLHFSYRFIFFLLSLSSFSFHVSSSPHFTSHIVSFSFFFLSRNPYPRTCL